MYDPEYYAIEQQQRAMSAEPAEDAALELASTSRALGLRQVAAAIISFGRPFRGFPMPDVEYPDFIGMGGLANIIGPGPTIINAQSKDKKIKPQPYAEALDWNDQRVTGTDALKFLETGAFGSIGKVNRS